MQYESLTAKEFNQLEGLDDWRFILGAIHTSFRAGSFPAGAEAVVAIADAAEKAVHHPDIRLRYPGVVSVVMTTHATGGLSTHDVVLAREISAIAAERGMQADPTEPFGVEIAIDTIDADLIRPFWQAVLGYTEDRGSLVDPTRQGPAIWFQQLAEPRPVRNRIHLDVSVPHDLAEERVAAAIAAGGTLVSDKRARSFWILADADGNEACVCTWQDRG